MYKGTQNLIFFTVFTAIMVFGVTPLAWGAEVTMNDLGIETPGMLPSNPFYFFKEWGRGIRKSLSFTELKKAELQLDILNEQIAEIKKLDELALNRPSVLVHALDGYADTAEILGEKLMILKSLKGNIGVEKLIDLVLQRSLQHYALLNSLFGNLEGVFDLRINNALQTLASANMIIPGNLDDVRHWVNRLQGAIKNQQHDNREWNAAGFIMYLEAQSKTEALGDLMRLRDRMLTAWTGKLQSIDDIDMLTSGHSIVNLELLDEAREKTMESAARNIMTVGRQALIEILRSRGLLTPAFVAQAIQESEAWVNDIESAQKKAPVDIKTIVSSIVERARFNEQSAKQFFEDGSFTNAYSQAMMARAVARHASLRLLEKSINYNAELENIKQYFDSLMIRAKGGEQIGNRQTKWTLALRDLETQIARLADLVANKGYSPADSPKGYTPGEPSSPKGNGTKIAKMIRDIQVVLGTLDVAIGE